MAVLTIRDLDEGLKAQLRIRAAENGRSMEAEVRAILASVLTKRVPGPGMGSRIR
ncbi:plasmid stability protein [Kibdelosporangium banguiense]|uniref:Plasmid stability protein n=1 Tax=Kibdelosporangium banguiense TaxID=1365924 RepID=A0ABS4TIJ9_9PSEU|nr:Arc family DNA-binding protein [Kibdelosporangium banguiense]MBP2323840.1 plasmid stability protein [Kibdelosporangium banguiense]